MLMDIATSICDPATTSQDIWLLEEVLQWIYHHVCEPRTAEQIVPMETTNEDFLYLFFPGGSVNYAL